MSEVNYYGMIKYAMELAEVPPTVHTNIATTTSGSGTGLTVDLEVFNKVDSSDYAGARWKINEDGSGYKDTGHYKYSSYR